MIIYAKSGAMSPSDDLTASIYKDRSNERIKLMFVFRPRLQHLVYCHSHELSLLASGSHVSPYWSKWNVRLTVFSDLSSQSTLSCPVHAIELAYPHALSSLYRLKKVRVMIFPLAYQNNRDIPQLFINSVLTIIQSDGHPITAHYVLVRQPSRHLKSECHADCAGT